MSSEPLVHLQGEVYYLPRVALPSGCKLTVQLSDISLADVSADVIAVCEKPITHQVPIPFELGYAAERYPEPGRTYAVSARIELADRLIWISDAMHEVKLTNENQSGLLIKVIQVDG